MARYWTTPTARNQIRNAIQETREKWGPKQAAKYRRDLQAGFQDIADNHQSFNSPHRDELAEGTPFDLHLVKHRYVAFQEHKGDVVIAGVYHESMDIPTRLRELQSLSRHEVSEIRREIDKNKGRQASGARAAAGAGDPAKAAALDDGDDPEERRRAEYRARGEAAETKHDKAMDDKTKAPAQEPGQKPGQGQDIDE